MRVTSYKLTHKKPEKSFDYLGGGTDNQNEYSFGLWDEYFCWNQNGFKNALYHFFEANNDNEKKEAKERAESCYPKQYPCIMKIWSHNTFEGHRLYADFYYI